VVVLPQHRLSQRAAVRDAAPYNHRVTLEGAQARCGLAGVGDPRLRPGHRLDRPARQRGDAREPLQEVERDALPGEQRAGRRPHAREHRPRGHPLAIRPARLEARVPLERAVDACDDRQASDDEPALGDEGGARGLPRRCAKQPGRYVLGRAVLGERALHLLAAQCVSQSPASDRSRAAPAPRRPGERRLRASGPASSHAASQA